MMSTSNQPASLAEPAASVRVDLRLDVSDERPGYLAIAGNGAHVRLSPAALRLLDAAKDCNRKPPRTLL